MNTLTSDARRLAAALKRQQIKVVFAESCTGGLVSASLAKVAGISEYLCGSAVTYRNNTKHEWLRVPSEQLVRPGPVSAVVAREMAKGVLRLTPEAAWSASVTGHLGPNAPKRLDGVVYIGIARRGPKPSAPDDYVATTFRHVLVAGTRVSRQREAVSIVLRQLLNAIIEGRQDL
ncbi:MAG: nicotinamide-nucleotide amidohydrolase family protein [Planctomycetales bacterium]|nr:nicotinamide-nucleotide amidohydrolase family protein [Planctomycetales bacterium]